MTLVLLAIGCNNQPYTLDTGDLVDTGVPQCGRVRGTEGILLYQEGGDAVRAPVDSPNSYEITTGVAGPLGDDRTYVAIVNGQALVSGDGGCNWEEQGSLPATGTWRLRAAGARVYAFDTTSTSGARSDDYGLTWAPFDAGQAFLGLPSVDGADPAHLRGVQARGVVTSSDGGDSWSVGGTLPAGATTPVDASVAPSNLDVALLGAAEGAWRTTDGGGSWEPVGSDAVTAIAIHPDDAAVFFAQTTDADAVVTVSRSADSGGTWNRMVDGTQVSLPTDSRLWPLPGDSTTVLSAFGPRHNDNTDSDGVNLYLIQAGVGTHTVFVGTWFHLNQIAFGGDRWVAAVDAVSAR